jgi:signal transduction histidine kinase
MLKAKLHPKPRHALVITGSVLIILFWFICVFYTQFNTFEHLAADKWWFPVFSPAFFIGSTLSTLREQWLPFLGLGLFALTPLFRRAIDNRLLKGDFGRLFLVFCLLQALVLLQRYYIYTLPDDTSVMSYALFLVVAAGLLGGRRLGVTVAIFNLFTSASLYIYNEAIEYERYLPPLTFFLTDPSVVAPLWVGWLAGYVSGYWPKWRFHWLTVTALGVAGEVMITVTGVMASWVPAMYVYAFWHNLFTTPIVLGGFLFLVYYRQNNSEEKLELTQTELALAEAELRALRAQINPHFMLNSLSVIHHLVRTQPETARNLLLDLSDLFQHTLRAGDFVPLSKELEHVRSYLALEQARLTKRLNVMWAVLAEDQLDTPVPTLILQPIIENAIVHGISPKPEGGTVSILVKQAGDDLHVQVVDNGIGFDTEAVPHPSHPERPSIGFKNIDMRLRLLYGEHYRLQVASTPGAGTTVELRIPIKEAATLEPLKELVNA